MDLEAERHALLFSRVEEGAIALWSTRSLPVASEADWRRLHESVRARFRSEARRALKLPPLEVDPSAANGGEGTAPTAC